VNVRNLLDHAVDLDDGSVLAPGEVRLGFQTSDRMKGLVEDGVLATVPASTETAAIEDPPAPLVVQANMPPLPADLVTPAPGANVTPTTEAPTTVAADTSTTTKEPKA
jgi:hypothetical protein